MSKVVLLARLPVPTDYRTPPDLPVVEAFDPAALRATAGPDVTALVTHSVFGVPETVWRLFPNLRLVANFGVGLDRIDLDEARSRGVVVTYTPDHLTADVADLAMALTLALLRNLSGAHTFVRDRVPGALPLSVSVSGRRLGVLGLGRIGLAVAHRAEAFGMEVAYFGRARRRDVSWPFFTSALELARASDVLVAAVPGGPQTKDLVSAEVLQALGPQGWFVNVARASIVDEAALIAALRSGTIAGAGLEVFGGSGSRLPEAVADLPNVILTPHIGSATRETRIAMADSVFRNVRAFLTGNALQDIAS